MIFTDCIMPLNKSNVENLKMSLSCYLKR